MLINNDRSLLPCMFRSLKEFSKNIHLESVTIDNMHLLNTRLSSDSIGNAYRWNTNSILFYTKLFSKL